MKKILCLFFSLLLVLPLVMSIFAVSDETVVKREYDIAASKSISDDFSIGFGGAYNLSSFPFDENYGDSKNEHDDISLITFTEYNYSDKSEFELYFYIYNPLNIEFDWEYDKNFVQIKSYVLGGVTKKLKLNYVCSEGAVIKLKADDLGGNIISGQSERSYEITGIELNNKNDDNANAIDYTVAKNFKFRENDNFLVQYYEDITVVVTETNHTYYRFQGEKVNEYFDLRSVYFNIPDEVIESAGDLTAILAEWEECKTYPMVVVNNQKIAGVLSSYVLNTKYKNDSFPVGMYWGDSVINLGAEPHYGFGWNTFENTDVIVSYLGGVFYIREWESEEELITADEMLEYQNKVGWNDWNFVEINTDNYGENSKKFEVSQSLDINYFEVPGCAFYYACEAFMHESLDFDVKESYCPLVRIEPDDFRLSDERFASKYLVHKDDVSKMRESVEEGKSMYLLRYTVTDYQLYTDSYGDSCQIEYWNFEDSDKYDNVECFVAEMVGIRNFDLIEAEYTKEGVVTVIPFVHSPTNAMVGITAPKEPDYSWLYYILMAILVLLVVTYIFKIYRYFQQRKREKAFDKEFLE